MRPSNPQIGFPNLPLKQQNKKGKQTEGKSYEKASFNCIGGNWIRSYSSAEI
jgi:hypothetical protein